VVILSIGILFGLGVGAYTSVDFALASECLPSELEFGKVSILSPLY